MVCTSNDITAEFSPIILRVLYWYSVAGNNGFHHKGGMADFEDSRSLHLSTRNAPGRKLLNQAPPY